MKLRYKERYTKPFLRDVKVIKKDKILLDRLNINNIISPSRFSHLLDPPPS